jgi:hypothetical protein
MGRWVTPVRTRARMGREEAIKRAITMGDEEGLERLI